MPLRKTVTPPCSSTDSPAAVVCVPPGSDCGGSVAFWGCGAVEPDTVSNSPTHRQAAIQRVFIGGLAGLACFQ